MLIGAVWLFGLFSSEIAMPSLYYDEGPVPPLMLRLPKKIFEFLICLGLVIPNRWTLRDGLYKRRMVIYGVISLWVLVAILLKSVISFLQGVSGFGVIPSSCILLVLSLVPPLTLYAKKKLSLKN